MKIVQRWVSIFLSAAILSTLVACGAADDKGQTEPAATQAPAGSVQELFGSSLFVGDSIIGGLVNDDLLPEANVMGALGATIQSTLDYVEEIASRKPSRVFLSMGQNDLLKPTEDAKGRLIQQYTQLVDRIRELVPVARVYVLSITPLDTTSPGSENINQQIGTFNAALQKLAKEKGIDFIDLAPIFTQYKIQYDGDGSHFTNAFYPILLGYLKEQTDLVNQPRGPALTDPNEAYKAAFRHSIFLGDSILGKLSYLNKLDSTNVIAPSGATLDLALLNIETLVSRAPEHVFILLGSNDIRLSDKQKFFKRYRELIGSIQNKLPKVRLHILSIPPVAEEALKQEPRYANITDFNQALEQLADEVKVDYVDLSPLFTANKIHHANNGIHFKPDFYPLLLDYLKGHVK
ncbi:GDSL-type esterase/lipase family protein [Paenibacillus sp. N1-5-1-14]|uniref:GDSL-type esterase/lipase family protein n=1 Tax=Paenibacillus radicibacter TaxID=2972488 RepID=UPI002158E712|nr:GDSL-type esterase/lipase family protein [Paenibacillus radicibacter]MCR8642542.1 GDSL-type esterase/lipase family protein [Paenibacillus radicibacter]